MVNESGRQVVRVALLKYTPQEVERLVERIDRDDWIEFGPQGIKNLVSRRRHLRLGYEKAKKSKNLSPNSRAGEFALANRDGNATLILDSDPIGKASGQRPTKVRCALRSSSAFSQITEARDIGPVADLLEDPAAASPAGRSCSAIA